MARLFNSGDRAELDKDPQAIATMFSFVAPRYDLVNDLASLGQEMHWRRGVVDALHPVSGEIILDLAAGTGASSFPIAKTGATVISVDLTEAMVQVGKTRAPRHRFVVGDGFALPFGDGVFDAATISFGLRNVTDPLAVLSEMRRVVRPLGTLVICEFSRPTTLLIRMVHRRWLRWVLPILSRIYSSNFMAYSYLSESIFDWPDQRGLATMMQSAGWTQIQWRNLTCGIVALHRAKRP